MTTMLPTAERLEAFVPRDGLALDVLLSAEELALRAGARLRRGTVRAARARAVRTGAIPGAGWPVSWVNYPSSGCICTAGCPGGSAVEYCLAWLELEAGDTGLRTVASVYGSLAMTAIHTVARRQLRLQNVPVLASGA
jgi:glutaryl-CoA dehydrogenase